MEDAAGFAGRINVPRKNAGHADDNERECGPDRAEQRRKNAGSDDCVVLTSKNRGAWHCTANSV
jgi:hypothetical protein